MPTRRSSVAPETPTGTGSAATQAKGARVAEELYPVSELAAMWRCSTDHIYRLIATKKLRTVQLGIGRAKTRIPASAAAEFIAAQTAPRTRKLRVA